jgi:hypothetical protein
LGEYIKFNNNNVWEIVPDPDSPSTLVKCYKREVGNKVNIPIRFSYIVDENNMGKDSKNFSYTDWKTLFGLNKLRKIASNFESEQYALPIIYWMKFIMGFGDDSKMERVNSTRYIFWK